MAGTSLSVNNKKNAYNPAAVSPDSKSPSSQDEGNGKVEQSFGKALRGAVSYGDAAMTVQGKQFPQDHVVDLTALGGGASPRYSESSSSSESEVVAAQTPVQEHGSPQTEQRFDGQGNKLKASGCAAVALFFFSASFALFFESMSATVISGQIAAPLGGLFACLGVLFSSWAIQLWKNAHS